MPEREPRCRWCRFICAPPTCMERTVYRGNPFMWFCVPPLSLGGSHLGLSGTVMHSKREQESITELCFAQRKWAFSLENLKWMTWKKCLKKKKRGGVAKLEKSVGHQRGPNSTEFRSCSQVAEIWLNWTSNIRGKSDISSTFQEISFAVLIKCGFKCWF